jgi:uncharacterized protein YndB with AHSA1/START domain
MTERTKKSAGTAAVERQTRSAEGQISIDATPEQVWKAITDERELVRWFPLDARVEPGPGGSVFMSWRNEFAATMKILLWDPPRQLRTSWSFHAGDEITQITDYLIEGKGGSTVIRTVTSGFPLDASWDGWVEGTNRGWAFELRSLKHYLERHIGEPRHVVYLRRRIPISSQTAWARLVADRELEPWLGSGQVFDRQPGIQHAAVVNDPPDSLFRASIEPGGPGADQREVVLWLSAWGGGDQERRIAEFNHRWTTALERLFPERDEVVSSAGRVRTSNREVSS